MRIVRFLTRPIIRPIIFCGLLLTLSATSFAQTQYWTGDGGRGKTITILTLEADSVVKNNADFRHLPQLVSGELVSIFAKFSAITPTNWDELERVVEHRMSDAFADSERENINWGHLTHTTHYMTGRLTRTPREFNLRVNITRTSDNATAASFTRNFSFFDLHNGVGARQASLELLAGMGVTLTAQGRTELLEAATQDGTSGQVALARGITARREGREVEALQHFIQASLFDPNLAEAAQRLSILFANISSGSMGDNIRGDIEWRRQWVQRLRETEEFFADFRNRESMPYTLFYVKDGIRQSGQINYQTETITMTMGVYLHASSIWTLAAERTLQAVYDGLHGTGKAREWGLDGWPQRPITNLNITQSRTNKFEVLFELLNDQNRVISRAGLPASGTWGISAANAWRSGTRPNISVSTSTSLAYIRHQLFFPDNSTFTSVLYSDAEFRFSHVSFANVSANDITDNLTIRVASVNGEDAEATAIRGALQIRAITLDEFHENAKFRYEKGAISSFVNPPRVQRGQHLAEIRIPSTLWGDQVVSIGAGAFKNIPIANVIIPNTVTSIGAEAFMSDQLQKITIGADVEMASNAIGGAGFNGLPSAYNRNGKRAGVYASSNFRFENGEIKGFVQQGHRLQENRLQEIRIPATVWGDQVVSIGAGAFRYIPVGNVIIPNTVTFIGAEAFMSDQIDSVTIGANVEMASNAIGGAGFDGFPSAYNRNGKRAGVYARSEFRFENGEIKGFVNKPAVPRGYSLAEIRIPPTIWGDQVETISSMAFKDYPAVSVHIPSSVRTIGVQAFNVSVSALLESPTLITIGDNVQMTINMRTDRGAFIVDESSLPHYFIDFYNKNGRPAGTYTWDGLRMRWRRVDLDKEHRNQRQNQQNRNTHQGRRRL